MADIHQIITLGIGTPADIAHFILVGLSPLSDVVVHPDGVGVTIGVGNPTVSVGGAQVTGGWTGGDATPGYVSPSWVTRQYVRQPSQRPRRRVRVIPEAPPAPPPRLSPIVRVPYVAQPVAPIRVPVRVLARSRGAVAGVGNPIIKVGIVVHVKVRRRLTANEAFVLGLAAGE